MIKIIFEVSEDFIREKGTPESFFAESKGANSKDLIGKILTSMSAAMLKNRIDEGQTEFQVNVNTLEEKEQSLFDLLAAGVFALAATESKKVDSETELKDE